MESKTISSLSIAKVLGHGNPPALIISCAVLALTLFFYIFTVGSYFHIDVYPLENRATYPAPFDAYVVDRYTDHLIIVLGTILWLALSVIGKERIVLSSIYGASALIATLYGAILLEIIALLSVPIIISFMIYNRFALKKILNYSANVSLNYVAIGAISIGLISFVISIAPLFSIPPKSIPVHDYMYDIFLLISSISPALVFILILFSPAKLLIKKFTIGEKIKETDSSSNVIKRRTKTLYLLLFMLLSVALALIPHYPTINSDNHQVGSDSLDYVNTLTRLAQSSTPQEFIKQVFTAPLSGDRPFTMLFLHMISKIIPTDLFYIVDHLPIILGPALVLAVFFLTRELTSNDTTSLLASFITAVSFHTLNGIYSGIYANWIALIIGYLSFVFLIRFLKTPSKTNLVSYSALMIILLFSHVYTWTILTLTMSIFLVAMFKINRYERKSIIVLSLIVILSIVIDVVRSVMTGFSGGIESDIVLANKGAGTSQLVLLWSNLTDTIQNYAGGQYSNFIIFTLGLYWLFRANSRKLSSVFLAIFLSVGVLPLLFGDNVIQSRALYDIPFQIPAAIALTYMKKKQNGSLIISSLCVWLLVISIRTVSNFYFVWPS